jgi:hypothetical protein
MTDSAVACYYVYENLRRKLARIHFASCPHCNHGKGTQSRTSGKNTKWHGPISRADAFALAKSLRLKTDIQTCGVCEP